MVYFDCNTKNLVCALLLMLAIDHGIECAFSFGFDISECDVDVNVTRR